jgi:hypothetical protein
MIMLNGWMGLTSIRVYLQFLRDFGMSEQLCEVYKLERARRGSQGHIMAQKDT